jgi:hypothetical protein
MSVALYALEILTPPPVPEAPTPPPQAAIIARDHVASTEVNIANAAF